MPRPRSASTPGRHNTPWKDWEIAYVCMHRDTKDNRRILGEKFDRTEDSIGSVFSWRDRPWGRGKGAWGKGVPMQVLAACHLLGIPKKGVL